MNIRFTKLLAIGTTLMGLIHIAATFTPMITDKLALLPEGAQDVFSYFSLECGALLILGGGVTYMLSGITDMEPSVRKTYILALAILVMDVVLAVCYMPHNPFAWMTFVLTMGLLCANVTRFRA